MDAYMNNLFRILSLLVITCLVACNRSSSTPKTISPIAVEVQTIAQTQQVHTHTYIGRIEESASIPVSSSTGGLITQLYVTNGTTVKEGQPLLTLDTLQAYNSLQIAQATLQQATDGYHRAQQVYAEGGVTEQKMVELRSQLQQAQSMHAIARKRLDDCTLRAPRSGIVAECDLQVGQHIAPALTALTLLDMQAYNVVFDVAESDIGTIALGSEGKMHIEAISATDIPIKIAEKNLIANRLSHTYRVKATLLHLSPSLRAQLLPGMVGKISLQSQMVEGIVIPPSCIHTQANSTMVWVVEDGKAARRSIEVGTYTTNGVLVSHGLQVGDAVITSGYQKMYNGAPVQY